MMELLLLLFFANQVVALFVLYMYCILSIQVLAGSLSCNTFLFSKECLVLFIELGSTMD